MQYNLPPVTFSTIGEPTQPGRWTQAQRLDDIAKALKVPVSQFDISQIKSIPDVWAQPLTFANAVVEDDHELHKSAIKQWRGLLALFGLQGFLQSRYQLRVQPLLVWEETGNAAFRGVLRTLLPTATVASDATWDEIGVISFQPLASDVRFSGKIEPLGLLSPISLVAAGKQVHKVKCSTVPWMVNGLGDPLDCKAGISREEWNALAAFLASLLFGLRSLSSTPAMRRLTGEIEIFHRETRRMAGEESSFAAFDSASELPAPFGFHRLYQLLFRSPAPIVRKGAGHVTLKTPDGAKASHFGGLVNGVILLDPEIATRTLRCQPEDIKIWDNLTFADLSSSSVMKQVDLAATNAGYFVLRPEEIFTETLIEFDDHTKIPAHSAEFGGRLLPLNPIVLLLLGKDFQQQIMQRLEIIDRGESIEVSLTLDLWGSQGDGRPRLIKHKVIRNYTGEEIVAEQPPNDLAIWPNFASENWRWNFMRFQYADRDELRTRFALSARGLVELLVVEHLDAPARARALQAWAASDGLLVEEKYDFAKRGHGSVRDPACQIVFNRTRFNEAEGAIGEQHHVPFGAEAVFFATVPDAEGRQVPAGCVLVGRTSVTQGQARLDVAVDFGTTNTVVYFKRRGLLEPAIFQNRIIHPIPLGENISEPERVARARSLTDFLPPHRQATPFPTVVKSRQFSGNLLTELQRDSRANDEPGATDNIYFMPRGAQTSLYKTVQFPSLEFQIKWAPEPERRLMIKRFLRQVMMMAAAEAVDSGCMPQNIHWHFSYPQAFSPSEAGSFMNFVKQAWRDIFDGLFNEIGSEVGVAAMIHFETEGQAALRFFAGDEGDFRGKTGELILMLDIGGGTTELGLAANQTHLWRSSVRIAGGDFFTRYLSNNLNILQGMGFKDTCDFINEQQLTGHDRNDFIELIVSGPDFNAAFEKGYDAISGMPEGQGIRHCASIALGGMLYYCGIAIREMLALEFGGVSDRQLDDLSIAFAGRGSTMFKYLQPGERDSQLGRLSWLLIDAARNIGTNASSEGAGLPGQPRVPPSPLLRPKQPRHNIQALFSLQPKHEVARGLLNPPLGDDKEHPIKFSPVGLALSVRTDGEILTLAATDDSHVLQRVLSVEDINLTEFETFLTQLRRRAGIAIEFKDDIRRQVVNRVRSKMIEDATRARNAEEQKGADDTIGMEAPFITALRALIELTNGPIANRDSKIRVREEEPKS